MSSVFVGITIDKKTHDKIEAKRGVSHDHMFIKKLSSVE